MRFDECDLHLSGGQRRQLSTFWVMRRQVSIFLDRASVKTSTAEEEMRTMHEERVGYRAGHGKRSNAWNTCFCQLVWDVSRRDRAGGK